MRLFSFYEEDGELIPVEVEIELWPGLPEVHFLGGADQFLKESAKRIKSAIRAQGYQFFPNQQVLVNLRPSQIKKSSRGLELAVAIGYLTLTHQLTLPQQDWHHYFYYGELSLKGEILAPQPLLFVKRRLEHPIVTGIHQWNLETDTLIAPQLSQLNQANLKPAHPLQIHWTPPSHSLQWQLNDHWAKKLGVVALGQHSLLIAGASGAGKTTAAHIIHALLPIPSPQEEEALKDFVLKRWIHQKKGCEENLTEPLKAWRPLVNPHHTIPLHSLIGGGTMAHGGELARAHLGLLLLDEFFEFSSETQEALREPLESNMVRITRGILEKHYPFQAQVVATTNLCPCGDWVPGQGPGRFCRYSLKKCRSYASRVTTPLLDRFEIIYFAKSRLNRNPTISVKELRHKIDRIRLTPKPSLVKISDYMNHDPLFQELSQRRKTATLRVAQSIAWWSQAQEVELGHVQEAMEDTVISFQKLKHWEDF
ncbi:MAG: ATP-binding protein [Bdellovibrionaceae bacterium]|nr:ATP-binding protein [Pseudobdellovibrionaceae bacterium]MDW8189599.1 ATP-binding protein [Pseudobdellovibrionaceae bacterium]